MENSYAPEIQRQGPKLVVSEEVGAEDCPYNVNVDVQGVGELLKSVGIKDEEIPEITIALERSKPRGLVERLEGLEIAGFYFRDEKRIALYTDTFWKQGRDLVADGNKIINEPKIKKIASIPFSRSRLSWYLRVAPEDRARNFLERLGEIRTKRAVNRTLAHEVSHAEDFHTNADAAVDYAYKPSGSRLLRHAAKGAAVGGVSYLGLSVAADQLGIDGTAKMGMVMGGYIGATAAFFISSLAQGHIESKTASSGELKAYKYGAETGRKIDLISLTPKQNLVSEGI